MTRVQGKSRAFKVLCLKTPTCTAFNHKMYDRNKSHPGDGSVFELGTYNLEQKKS